MAGAAYCGRGLDLSDMPTAREADPRARLREMAFRPVRGDESSHHDIQQPRRQVVVRPGAEYGRGRLRDVQQRLDERSGSDVPIGVHAVDPRAGCDVHAGRSDYARALGYEDGASKNRETAS